MDRVPDRNHSVKTGRSAVSPKPKIELRAVLDVERVNAAISTLPDPHSISMSWRVKSWPMFGNDNYGDCVYASAGHQKLIHSVYGKQPFTLVTGQVLSAYSAVEGFVIGDPNTDHGSTIAAAAGYLRTKGFQGTPDIVAYAGVDAQDDDAVQAAHYVFGGLWFGADLPRRAQQQYEAGQVWQPGDGGPDDVPGSWGGHAMLRINSVLRKRGTAVTWGGLQVFTDKWWDTFVDEAFATIPVEWQRHMPSYLHSHQILDYDKLTGLLAQVTAH